MKICVLFVNTTNQQRLFCRKLTRNSILGGVKCFFLTKTKKKTSFKLNSRFKTHEDDDVARTKPTIEHISTKYTHFPNEIYIYASRSA